MSKIVLAFVAVMVVVLADAINPLNEARVGRMMKGVVPPKNEDTPNYGSYVTTCDQVNQVVIFHNYVLQNCSGPFTNFSKPLNKCYPQDYPPAPSWNAFCNATNMWYNNFATVGCKGASVLTRMYTIEECFNCPNPECKNP